MIEYRSMPSRETSMLSVKIYRTDSDETYCDACSLRFLNSGVAMARIPIGTPCTCDGCGMKARAS